MTSNNNTDTDQTGNRPGRLAGKTAVITGGAAGMGRSTSLAFAREGARVAILDIQKEAGEETVQMIREAGGTAEFIETDVSDAGLFNHAGTITVKPLHESTEDDYDRLMDINVRSAFLVCRRAVKEMSDNGGGSIVITASIASELGYALESLYCMTKGAVLQLARAISVEYRDQGIRWIRQDGAWSARNQRAGSGGAGVGRRGACRRAGAYLRARRSFRGGGISGLG
jgi:NAD(P)-dependent dehydrogenase (short-subunit alcohol dehydrogenase family)